MNKGMLNVGQVKKGMLHVGQTITFFLNNDLRVHSKVLDIED